MDSKEVIRWIAALALVSTSLASAQSIETVAGFDPDGVRAADAGLTVPWGLASDTAGNIYFSEPIRHRVYKVTPDGLLQIVAGNGSQGSSGDGGSARDAQLDNPTAIAVDQQGNLYIATNTSIRCVASDSGVIRTVTKVGGDAPLRSLSAITAGSPGFIIAADPEDHRIKRINVETGEAAVIAGNGKPGTRGDSGPATAATLAYPAYLAVDGKGNIYYSELAEARVRRIDASSGIISTVSIQPAGEDFPDEYEVPSGLAADVQGNLYVSQVNRSRVLKLAGGDGDVTVFAGTGSQEYNGDGQLATAASVPLPEGVTADAGGNVYIAQIFGPRIRRVEAGTAMISTIAGNGLNSYSGDGRGSLETQLYEPANILPTASGDIIITSAFANRVLRVDPTGHVATVAGSDPTEHLSNPQGLWLDANGDMLFSDLDNRLLRRIPVSGGSSSIDAEMPVAALSFSTRLNYPGSIVSDGTRFYLSSPNDHHVWVIQPGGEGGWQVKPFAGTGEPGFSGDGGAAHDAQIRFPSGLALDSEGNLYFADSGNHRVRKIDATGAVSTFWPAGDPDPASVPTGLAFDAADNLYVADAGLHHVVRIGKDGGGTAIVAGSGVAGFSGDGGAAAEAQLNRPCGIAFDKAGNLYVADTGNQRVRRVNLAAQ